MNEDKILAHNLMPLRQFLTKNSINKTNINWIKKYLEKITFLTSLTYKQKVSSFQRITINKKVIGKNNRIDEIKYLKNPKKELVKSYGRANKIQESIFYATFNPITALSEMRPNIGDVITISTWRLKTDYDLTVTPIFKSPTKDGVVYNEMSLQAEIKYNKVLKQYDNQLRKQIDIMLKFIADCFSKEVEDTNHYDYYLSSYFANRIFWELQDGEIDAILFPSVRQSLALTNIALKPLTFENNYKIDNVKESIVTQIPSNTNSGWLMRGTGYSKEFFDGHIQWK